MLSTWTTLNITIALLILSFYSTTSSAQKLTVAAQKCLLERIETADSSATIEQLRKHCLDEHAGGSDQEKNRQDDKIGQKSLSTPKHDAPYEGLSGKANRDGVISARMKQEKQTELNPYVITPHRLNYVLPAQSTNRINTEPFASLEGYEENLDDVEAKFQLSVKIPLTAEDLYVEGDALYFAFTLEAWWQVYSDNISKPFRETNYRPEIFYLMPLDWHPYGGNTGVSFGIEHQSNGRDQLLSRSWNRIYANFLYEVDNAAFHFQPWWRIPEDEKEFPLDSDGDDNPDITDFMGHFELGGAYKWNNCELFFNSRQNFATHKGAIELGFTFPLWRKVRGYATVFDGYGESLIDYNYRQTRIGLGFALTNIL